MTDERGSWYLLTAIVIGIGLGLLYSWVISPVEFIDTSPISLREDYKDHYRAMIAAAYAASGNLERAKERLLLLGDENAAVIMVAQAQRSLAQEGVIGEAQALANLAAALGQAPTPLPTEPERTATPQPSQTESAPAITQTASLTQTATRSNTETLTRTVPATVVVTNGPGGTPTITRTPRPSQTAFPTSTATLPPTLTATLAPPFVLDNLVKVCNPAILEPQIQVFVANAAGVGIARVEIIVTWNGGEEHFYTGLKPDIDSGYADFVIVPEVIYVLQVADGGQLITDLSAQQCTDEEGDVYWGSLRLLFSHP